MSPLSPIASFRGFVRADRAMGQLAVLGMLLTTAVVLAVSLALFMLTGV